MLVCCVVKGVPLPCHCPCSTLIEEGSGKSLTRGMGSRVWPWDMTNGIPIACGW